MSVRLSTLNMTSPNLDSAQPSAPAAFGGIFTPTNRSQYHIVSQSTHEEQPPSPLPKIKLKAIMTVFGSKQAMFSVQFPAQSSQPANEQSLILGEGESEGSIKVLEINEKTGKVKVGIHGNIMEIGLLDPAFTRAASSTSGRAPK